MNKTTTQPCYPIKLHIINHYPLQTHNFSSFVAKTKVFDFSVHNSNIMSISKPKNDSTLLLNQTLKKTCRYCWQEETSEQNFISPCLCDGTAAYVHEDCLKTWVIQSTQKKSIKSKYSFGVSKVKCEVCNFEYIMNFYLSNRFSKEKCKEHIKPLLLSILIIMLVVVGFIGIILVIIIGLYKDLSERTKKLLYLHSALLGCMIIILISVVVYCKKYRKNMHVQVLDKWVILDVNHPEAKQVINNRLLNYASNEDKSDQNIIQNFNVNIGMRLNKGKDNVYIDKKSVKLKNNSTKDISPSIIQRSEFRKRFPYIRSLSQIISL